MGTTSTGVLREKARSDNRGIPEGPATKAGVQERCDCMDAEGPEDRQEHKGDVEDLARLALVVGAPN